jgi:hypothetical protein
VPVTRKKKRKRTARLRRPKHLRGTLTIKITSEVLLVIALVIWLTDGRLHPDVVSALIR